MSRVLRRSGYVLCRNVKGRRTDLSTVLTDRGTEYCGTDGHEYELYLAVKILITLGPRPRLPRPTASVNGITRPCSMSSTEWPFAKRFTDRSMSSKPIWTHG